MLRLQNENDEVGLASHNGISCLAEQTLSQFVGIRIHGKCPERVDASMVKNFYKFDSGSRRFAVLRGMQNFSHTTDAVGLSSHKIT